VELRKIVSVTTAENNPVLYRNDLGVVKLPIRKRLSTDNNIISTKATTGNAPNKLEATNNMVEDAQKKTVMSKEPLTKLMCFQVKPISHQLL